MKTVNWIVVTSLIVIAVACGYSRNSGATPVISQLSPANTAAGSGQFQLEVDGSNFASGATIKFNGVSETTTVVSSSKVTAMIPASAIMAAATVPVTVTNPGTGGIYGMGSVTSSPMNFTIN